ncbi:MAG: hypothetical protein ACI8W8_003084 [Rhodothermales bacterium]|jgi:hypothetical protein
MITRTLFTLGLALACTVCSNAAPTAEAIVAKHLEAIGGLEAHSKLTTRQLKGTLKIEGLEGDIAMTITQKAPDKKHTQLVHPLFQVMEVMNGERGWGQSAGQDLRMFAGKEKVQKLRDARFHGAVEMITEGEISYKKEASIGDKDCHVLTGTYGDDSPWAGIALDFYIDTKTYLLHRLESVEGVVDISDFMSVDGIKIPRRAEIRAPGFRLIANIDTVRHGVEVDDALFETPVKKECRLTLNSHPGQALVFTNSYTLEHGEGQGLKLGPAASAARVTMFGGLVRKLSKPKIGLNVDFNAFKAGSTLSFWGNNGGAGKHNWITNDTNTLSPAEAPQLVLGWQEGRVRLVAAGSKNRLEFAFTPIPEGYTKPGPEVLDQFIGNWDVQARSERPGETATTSHSVATITKTASDQAIRLVSPGLYQVLTELVREFWTTPLSKAMLP